MELTYTLNTLTGYRAQLVIEAERDGKYAVKSAAYLIRNVLSPFVVLARFETQDAATRYCERLQHAIEDVAL